MQTLEILTCFVFKTALKFKNLDISKILNSDTNIVFPVPFKVMYLRYA